jgi:hypothetical protein
MENIPHVILSSEVEWDPLVLDHDFKEDEQWGGVTELESSLDEFGDYKHLINLAYFQCQDGNLFDNIFDQCVFDEQTTEPLQEI